MNEKRHNESYFDTLNGNTFKQKKYFNFVPHFCFVLSFWSYRLNNGSVGHDRNLPSCSFPTESQCLLRTVGGQVPETIDVSLADWYSPSCTTWKRKKKSWNWHIFLTYDVFTKIHIPELNFWALQLTLVAI